MIAWFIPIFTILGLGAWAGSFLAFDFSDMDGSHITSHSRLPVKDAFNNNGAVV